MKKAEIDGKSWESRGFQEIVAFAEAEKFIDTPVVGAGLHTRRTPTACPSASPPPSPLTWTRRFC